MTLDRLRILLGRGRGRGREREHVTRAAETLNLARSAVSSAIPDIEGRHATKLSRRVGRGIELTDHEFPKRVQREGIQAIGIRRRRAER